MSRQSFPITLSDYTKICPTKCWTWTTRAPQKPDPKTQDEKHCFLETLDPACPELFGRNLHITVFPFFGT